ncbi:hypothetical protein AAXB25_21010 [Paenibacillus lautus]|uniref:hypothetical protein n=1 Tax=Paenibacillus lautus TaxID=1401 RepID=UPI003D2B6A41
MFGLKEQNPPIYPLAVLFIIVAWNTYINTVYVADIIQNVWSSYALLHLLVIPTGLYLIGLTRTKILKWK